MLKRVHKKRRLNFKFSKTQLVLPVIFLFLAAFYYIGFFKVKSVDLEVNNLGCATSEQIVSTLNIKDRYFFLIEKSNLEKKLKSKYICVKDLKISNNLFGKAKVTVLEREAVASILVSYTKQIEEDTLKIEIPEGTSSTEEANRLKNRKVLTAVDYYLQNESTGSAKFLVDNEGKIFAETERSGIPLLTFYNLEAKLGSEISKDKIHSLVKIYNKLKELEISEPNIKIFEDLVIIDNKPRILISLSKGEIDNQLASLQLILQKAKIEFRSVESVDLRFNKPVVVFTPKK